MDALREAAFEYQDLMKLEKRVSSFVDDPKLPCEAALKKMYSLLEKYELSFHALTCWLQEHFFDFVLCSKAFCYFVSRVEQSVYALLRTRDMAISRCKEFGIPVDWLLDSGVVGKVCFTN